MSWLRPLQESDPVIASLIADETARQENGLELIASENFVSPAVLEAMGTSLTNKYAEGYPGKRYYGGCEVVDKIESLARERALQVFGADHANVQPHSGASANLAAYFAVLQIGDKVMGLALPHGGHLTHGSPVNFSGKWYDIVPYHVDESTGRINMDRVREQALTERPKMIIAGGSAYPRIFDFEAFASIAAEFPGLQGGPLEHVIAAKAVAFGEALQPEFKKYSQNIVDNARVLGEALVDRGYTLVSGGTDTHLLLMDLRSGELTGKIAEEALGRAGMHANKNTVPGDQRSPFVTSGIRLGTPALTTRGMGPEEMTRIAGFMDDILRAADTSSENSVVERVASQVRELAAAFPLYAAEEAAP